jgi:hypothetical protein
VPLLRWEVETKPHAYLLDLTKTPPLLFTSQCSHSEASTPRPRTASSNTSLETITAGHGQCPTLQMWSSCALVCPSPSSLMWYAYLSPCPSMGSAPSPSRPSLQSSQAPAHLSYSTALRPPFLGCHSSCPLAQGPLLEHWVAAEGFSKHTSRGPQ